MYVCTYEVVHLRVCVDGWVKVTNIDEILAVP
jgi:hypothetical protein